MKRKRNPESDITETHLRRLLKERDYERDKLDKLVTALLESDEKTVNKIINQHLEDVPVMSVRYKR